MQHRLSNDSLPDRGRKPNLPIWSLFVYYVGPQSSELDRKDTRLRRDEDVFVKEEVVLKNEACEKVLLFSCWKQPERSYHIYVIDFPVSCIPQHRKELRARLHRKWLSRLTLTPLKRVNKEALIHPYEIKERSLWQTCGKGIC